MEQLLEQFRKKKEEQVRLQLVHQDARNFGMAYLALWAILEGFAKQLGPKCQRAALRRELQAWLGFLDNEEQSQNPPKNISPRTFELANKPLVKIPPLDSLKLLLSAEDAPVLYELLDPKKTFRKHRNSIAHSGKDTSERIYEEFKNKVQLAIDEIESWLDFANRPIQ